MLPIEFRTRYLAHGLWVTEDSLGLSTSFRRSGADCRISLPSNAEDFGAMQPGREVPPVPAVDAASQFTDPDYPFTAVALNLFLVSVSVDGTGLTKHQLHSEEYFEVLTTLWERWEPVSRGIAQDFLTWIRVTSAQSWLGVTGHPPIPYGRTGVFDSESGEGQAGLGPNWVQPFLSPRLAVSREQVDECYASTAARTSVEVAQTMLADARFIDNTASPADTQRSLLSAAIACELRTKEVIRAGVAESRLEECKAALSSVSNIGTLLDHTLTRYLNKSLKVDDRELYQSLAALGRKRDRIVHRGETATSGEAVRWVGQAQQLFTWLG